MKKHSLGFTLLGLLAILFVLAAAYGWVANVIKLLGSSFDPLSVLTVARMLGVFVPPLGAVLGWC